MSSRASSLFHHAPKHDVADQLDLFTDYAAQEKQQEEDAAALARERKVQEAMLSIKKRFGKNASRTKLDEKQRMLEKVIAQQPELIVTWFRPDDKKDGGSYVTTTGNLKRTDGVDRVMVMTDGTRIPLDDIIELESEWLPKLP